MTKKPTFICIGPEKTGTSWLYDNLKAHPQVYLPHIKEIRYFWEKAFLPNQDITKRLTNSHWHNELYRNYLKKRVNFYLDNQDKLSKDNSDLIDNLIWDFKYLLFPHDDNWYFSLFKDSQGKVTGDITPLYYQLPDKEIQHISEILPNLKIIILLRNPIDRAWSKVKMNLCQHKNRELKNVNKEEFYKNFDKGYNQLPSYSSLIRNWRKYFQAQNIYIGYYDKLVEQPSMLFDEICNFLDIQPSLLPLSHRNKLSAKVNKGLDINIPDQYLLYLSEIYRNCIKQIATEEKHEPYPKRWLEMVNKLNIEKSINQLLN